MVGCPQFYLGQFTEARVYLEKAALVYDPAQHRSLAWLYGQEPGIPLFHGLAPIEGSAQQLSDYVDQVLGATGAQQVDIVGHSQGGMMPRYYLKFLGGAAKVGTLVGISPVSHGTTLFCVGTLLAKNDTTNSVVSGRCPACRSGSGRRRESQRA